jgi:mycothiol synthase
MTVVQRRYEGEEDYWRIRDFLRQVFLLNGRRESSWQAYRWDYWRWHGVENLGHGSLEQNVFLWEDSTGEIAAVLNSEGPGSAFLHVHPDRRLPILEEEMLEIAEQHLGIPMAEGGPRLEVWALAQDAQRQEILTSRGYHKGEWPEFQRRRSLHRSPADQIAGAFVAEGYTVRALGDSDEHPARNWLSWRAFHPDEPDEDFDPRDYRDNIKRAPLYRRDLDLIAVAPDGEFASFCTVWFDDVTRTGAFEPVGTAPEHQLQGLGKAVMTEGLRRLQQLGATLAFVGSYRTAAHALYESVGFTQYDLNERWIKRL